MLKQPLRFTVLLLAGMLLGAPAASAAPEGLESATDIEVSQPALDNAVEETTAVTADDSHDAEHHAAAADGAHAETHDTAHADDVGFPQLKTETYASQVFWLFVAFTLLYVLMSKVALPRVSSMIDARSNMREDDLSRAQSMQAEAAKIKAAYDASLAEAQGRAQEIMAAAEKETGDKANAESTRFTEHAMKRLITAEQNINRAKNDAMQSLTDISADIAMEMVNKITGVQVQKADAKKAVAAALQEG